MFGVTVGLALGGGAARGFAHLGVIQVLEEAGIPIHVVSGTSMGALVGALFCASGSIYKARSEAMKFLDSQEFRNSKIHTLRQQSEEQDAGVLETVSHYINRGRVIASTVTRPSVLQAEDLFEMLRIFVDDRDIRSLKIPLHIVATDITTGEEVVIKEGPVIDAVAASSAVPGAFPAIALGGRKLIDGGVLNMVPISAALDMGADYVIASNVIHDLSPLNDAPRALEVYFRTNQITKRALTDLQLRFADVLITPQVGHIHWADFTRSEEILDAGAASAREAVARIKIDLKRLGRTPRFLRRKKVIPDAAF